MSEQIRITIKNRGKNTECELLHDTGRTLLETMRESLPALPALCNGMGTCGKCMVRFCSYAPLPTQTDRRMITPDRLREGFRLACTARPGKSCVVEADFAAEREAEEKRLHVLTGYGVSGSIESGRVQEAGQGCGGFQPCRTIAAADIGTTTIAMQLLDVKSGSIRDTYTCLNPQRAYGMDVISRIRAANEGRGEELRKLAADALALGLRQFRQSAGQQGIAEPEWLCIACNTAMGHIFMGYPVESLGRSPFLPVNSKTDVVEWEGIRTVLLPGLSAFVGGDILAGLYACGLCHQVLEECGAESVERFRQEDEQAWLFMDLGTNAEMVMGVGTRVAATAAAAGPAFEGRGRDGAMGPERIRAVADLLERGIADETGLLEEPYFETGIEVEVETGKEGGGSRSVFITQEDIRDIQMAKAAVRAGIHFLMERLGLTDFNRIRKIYIAGGMGFYLDKKAAVRIGLLPGELEERIQAVGNTALAGAGLFGRNGWQETGRKLEAYAGRIEVFQMAELAEFAEIYVGYMDFGRETV